MSVMSEMCNTKVYTIIRTIIIVIIVCCFQRKNNDTFIFMRTGGVYALIRIQDTCTLFLARHGQSRHFLWVRARLSEQKNGDNIQLRRMFRCCTLDAFRYDFCFVIREFFQEGFRAAHVTLNQCPVVLELCFSYILCNLFRLMLERCMLNCTSTPVENRSAWVVSSIAPIPNANGLNWFVDIFYVQ